MDLGKGYYSENTPEIVELSKLSEEADLIENDLFIKYDVKRGLRDLNGKGVLTGLTRISKIVSVALRLSGLYSVSGIYSIYRSLFRN